eukprot:9997134-Alexandrium_andersonii.AAC.1
MHWCRSPECEVPVHGVCVAPRALRRLHGHQNLQPGGPCVNARRTTGGARMCCYRAHSAGANADALTRALLLRGRSPQD